MKYWLMKTEPDVFSFDDLVRAPKRTTSWEGVRNYQARNFMRDEMKKGDRVLIYHSNVDDAGVVGVAEVAREGHPDLAALDPTSDYFDEKAKTHRLKNPMTRAKLSDTASLKDMMVLKRGARLSVQPVTRFEFETIFKVGQAEIL